ncbi:hypothetical protein SAMD00023353_1401570 [Rosellinia necatrix]|uniref:Myb/SANT-like domain-containing protein n=1 Tax=Rosellinia necatrix TaxID=77044 RepID=A0A1W2TD18_ROSNE|nr:hypothetical protein SAMD00023353_1401570 [Rosellinia necatrix]
MPKWDDEKMVDLLMAMRVAENGYNAVTKDTWFKITAVMKMMGHGDATWTGLSQRWSKVMQKDFMEKYPQALAVAAGTHTPATTGPAATDGAKKAGRGQKRKREAVDDDEDEGHDEANAVKKAPASKNQKKN